MPNKIELLPGQVFGRLTVLAQAEHRGKTVRWKVRCACSTELLVASSPLRNGVTRSCGCLHREELAARNLTHGHNAKGDRSPTYSTWSSMLNRCQSTRPEDRKYYLDRGIAVCDRWQTFENFLEDMGERPEGLEIDRRENDKGYYKENCHWTTRKKNMRNVRTNRLITYQGREMPISEAAEISGINYGTLYTRINKETGTDIFRPVKGPAE